MTQDAQGEGEREGHFLRGEKERENRTRLGKKGEKEKDCLRLTRMRKLAR